MADKKKFSLAFLKSSKIGIVVIALLFVTLLCVYPDNNIFTWLEAKREIRSQERQMRRYQLEINEMQEKIKELTVDRDTLERFARENFHFAAEGEDIYLIEE